MISDAILGRRALAIVCAVLILVFTPYLVSCAVLAAFKPELTTAARVLLAVLDDLLDDYESASIADSASDSAIAAFEVLQEARHAVILELLEQCHGQIPGQTIEEYRVRIQRVPSRSP